MSTINFRQVYQHNLEEEFALIDGLLPAFRYVAIDTEFPGTVVKAEKPYYLQSEEEIYESVKSNVDATMLIQLGLTLSDENGTLPRIGSECSVWQFNFAFDVDVDNRNPDSIQLLRNQGIEFDKHKANGIDVKEFARLFMNSRLGLSLKLFSNFHLKGGINQFHQNPYVLLKSKINQIHQNPPVWVAFQGLYDLGYLLKILRKDGLPETRLLFTFMVRMYFGSYLFDVKEIIKPLGLRGGLDKVANQLEVKRSGKSHQAGSDSLLTMEIFMKLKQYYFNGSQIYRFNWKMQGLEDESKIRGFLMELKQYYFGGGS